MYTIFVCVIAFVSCGTPYYFDFRERKSMHPVKREAIKRLTNRDVEDITSEVDLLFDE